MNKQLNLSELLAQKKVLEQQIEKARKERINEFKAEFINFIDNSGYTKTEAFEILGVTRFNKKVSVVPTSLEPGIKYINPVDGTEWISGSRGRRPPFVVAAIEKGTLEKLKA